MELLEEKHLIYFDSKRQYAASYTFALKAPLETAGGLPQGTATQDGLEEGEGVNTANFNEAREVSTLDTEISFQIRVKDEERLEWVSEYYAMQVQSRKKEYGGMPFSLQTFFDIYEDPRSLLLKLVLKVGHSGTSRKEVQGKCIGKLIVWTNFSGNPFILPVNIIDGPTLDIDCPKTVSVVIKNEEGERVICCGTLQSETVYNEIASFTLLEGQVWRQGYVNFTFRVKERVYARQICVLKGNFVGKQLQYENIKVRIISSKEIMFMPSLVHHLKTLKSIMELEDVTIVQGVDTHIEDCSGLVFYADAGSLEKRLFRNLLHDKVKDLWLIQGMVHYVRSNKHFQDCVNDLVELVTEGEEIVPLCNEDYSFDRVWQLKARFFYHVLSNFKAMHDSGSASLASLIVDQSRKGKVTSQMLFKRLKNKYFKKNFRTVYDQQFVKSTGINRIFYQLIDVRKEGNKVKIIVRQKALANKTFRQYNAYRIKLEQAYNELSPLTNRIIAKNSAEQGNRRRELSGPLAVPKSLKCIPYFRGNVAVETDASEEAFDLALREQNIIEEKQNATAKTRTTTRKANQNERFHQRFSWIMVDTAHVFPAVYKHEDVKEAIIIQQVKKHYDSEQQEIKVLNCISSRDHSSSEKLCRALMDKLKINQNPSDNSSLEVKRKILQIMPVFLHKNKDAQIWEDLLGLLRLYDPPCHDHSEEGFHLLLSLIEAVGSISYNRVFHYYFEKFHRILLTLSKVHECRSPQHQLFFRKNVLAALMRWPSKYSFDILKQVKDHILLSLRDPRAHLPVMKVVFTYIFSYLRSLSLPQKDEVVKEIYKLLQVCVEVDYSQQLFCLRLSDELSQNEQNQTTLEFLKSSFKTLEQLQEGNLRRYCLALQVFKDILTRNRKRYGLEMQLEQLNEDQNYFVAQYLWRQLQSKESLEVAAVRLQWAKIYRVFYFYYTPVVTLAKLRANDIKKEFDLSATQTKEILDNIMDFIPDIRWLSGYDSRSSKQLKAKYDLLNENKRRKKYEEYTFSQNNAITIFVKEHPGRETWDELAREAMRIFISIYGEKELNCDGPQTEKFKAIEERLKKIQHKLKRGRMPDFYNYQKLKEEIYELLAQFNEYQQRVVDIFEMVETTLREIAAEKERREIKKRDQMRIFINLDDKEDENAEEEGQKELQGFIFKDDEPDPVINEEAEEENQISSEPPVEQVREQYENEEDLQ